MSVKRDDSEIKGEKSLQLELPVERKKMQYEEGYKKTVYEMLKESCDRYEDHILFSYVKGKEVEEISYREFYKDVCKVAQHFAKSGLQGEYIVIDGKNEYEAIVAMFGAAVMGAIAAVINFDLPEEDIAYALESLKPALIVCDEDYYDVIEEYVKKSKPICMFYEQTEKLESIYKWLTEEFELYEYVGNQSPDEGALVLMTSGSTSRSKLVLLSHYGYMPTLELYAKKTMLLFPLYHVAGTMILVNAIAKGVNLCLSNLKNGIRDAEWFRPIEVVAVPAFISVLVNRSRQGIFDISSIR